MPDVEIIDPFTSSMQTVLTEAGALLLEKHRGYGPKNISDAPGGPLNGLRVRLFDKLARLSNMIDNDIDTAASESLRDTLIDIANYGVIGVMVLDGRWPSTVVGRSKPAFMKRPRYRDKSGDVWEWRADYAGEGYYYFSDGEVWHGGENVRARVDIAKYDSCGVSDVTIEPDGDQ